MRYLYTCVCKVNTIRNVKCLVQTDRERKRCENCGHVVSLPWALASPCACDGQGEAPVFPAWVVPTDRCHPNRKPLHLPLLEVPCLPLGMGVGGFL